jgi:hypothetical protein
LQGNEKEKMMTDTSGRKCLELFGNYARAGSWAKTFSALLIGTGGWYSRKCKLTWKVKGTKYNRMYFQLAPSTLPTDGTGFGLLLKTPCAADGYTESLSKKEQRFGNSGTLAQEVQTGFVYQRGLLPTPNKVNGCDLNSENLATRNKGNLEETVAKWVTGLLPTPASMDWKGEGGNGSDLNRTIGTGTGTTSQLNPRFVLEMMGFPADWTELPFQNGETNP